MQFFSIALAQQNTNHHHDCCCLKFCRSQSTCACADNNSNYATASTQSTIATSKLDGGNRGNPAATDPTTLITGCVCASGHSNVPTATTGGGGPSAGTTIDTIVSSNTRFQAISAISVAQDGVVHVADQGM